jgi:hypothetical protein
MMQSNFLIIVFSGISLSLLGICVLLLPDGAKSFVNHNIECFLTIPPISVASYIFIFKYHEKFIDGLPPLGALFNKILQGTLAAVVFFFLTAVISGIFFRLFIILRKGSL